MLKIVLVSVLLTGALVSVSARPQKESDASILRSENELDDNGNGNFKYGYETSNSIAAVAQGRIKNPEAASDDQIQEIKGCYSYIGADNVPVVVVYTADENGFQPNFDTGLTACPDLNTIRSSSPAQAAPARAPAPRPAPRAPAPAPARRVPAPAPAPARPAPQEVDEAKFYKVLNERGEVVAVIPKQQAIQQFQSL